MPSDIPEILFSLYCEEVDYFFGNRLRIRVMSGNFSVVPSLASCNSSSEHPFQLLGLKLPSYDFVVPTMYLRLDRFS